MRPEEVLAQFPRKSTDADVENAQAWLVDQHQNNRAALNHNGMYSCWKDGKLKTREKGYVCYGHLYQKAPNTNLIACIVHPPEHCNVRCYSVRDGEARGTHEEARLFFFEWLCERSIFRHFMVQPDAKFASNYGILIDLGLPANLVGALCQVLRHPYEWHKPTVMFWHLVTRLGWNEELAFVVAFSTNIAGAESNYQNGYKVWDKNNPDKLFEPGMGVYSTATGHTLLLGVFKDTVVNWCNQRFVKQPSFQQPFASGGSSAVGMAALFGNSATIETRWKPVIDEINRLKKEGKKGNLSSKSSPDVTIPNPFAKEIRDDGRGNGQTVNAELLLEFGQDAFYNIWGIGK